MKPTFLDTDRLNWVEETKPNILCLCTWGGDTMIPRDGGKPNGHIWEINDTFRSPSLRTAIDRAIQFSPPIITDTDRLNWLIAHSAYLSHSRDGEVCNVWFSQDPFDDSNGAVPAEGYPQKCYYDAREAIDAVMCQPKNKRLSR